LAFSNKFGRRVDHRLRTEKIIWLTTVDAHYNNTPQPRPVWFHWDDHTVLIFSEKGKAKLRHIAVNARVSLNFNTDEDGGDVTVLIAEATLPDEPPPASRVSTYLRKYRAGIKDLGMTPAEFTETYAVPILITPQAMRGFVE
jgi:PPOX class probable F420-dependent enzyme